MGRLTKIILALIAALAGLFAVAAVALLLFFDPNDFREDVERAVMDSTGRELNIEGDVSLQLFPWLAVEIGQARLGNAPGFGDEPFAELERAELSVRVLPLFMRQEVTVGTAEIDGLRLSLSVDEQGRTNWDDFVSQDEADAQREADAQLAAEVVEMTAPSDRGALDISGVDISNAFIRYTQLATGESYTLSDVNLEVGRVSDDLEPVPASGSMRFDVQPAGISGDVEFRTVVAFDTDNGVVSWDGFLFEGVVEGLVDAPTRVRFATDGIEVRLEDQVVSMQPLELSALNVDVRAEVEPFSYAGAIEPTASIAVDAFSPRSLMHMFGVEPPETADPVALSSVMISANAAVGETTISLTDIDFKVDDTTFTGSLSLPLGDGGSFRFDLDGDAIDLNRYMAPASEAAAVEPGDTVPVEIPADLVRAVNANGKMKITSVVLGRLQLDNVTLGLNSSDGRMRLHPIAADLYGGSYNGDVRIDASASTPVLSVNETIGGVDLGELAVAMFQQENITGSIDGNFSLTGRGSDLADVQRSLSGTMSFELKDGTYEGTDIWYELRRARALIKQETPPEPVLPARTKFSSVTATGVVTDGIMRNDDFAAFLPFIQLTGKGDVNIPDATVDYSMTARVFKKPESPGDATPEELEDFTKTVVPIRITGPLASPKVAPDAEELLRQEVEEEIKEVEEEIKDAIEDKLKDLLKR